MTKIVRANSESDFLSLVPSLLGFQPSDAIVIVIFERNRTVGCARFDAESIANPSGLADFFAAALAASAPNADGVAVIGYSDRPDIVAEIRAFGEVLHRNWLVKGTFVVGAERWQSLLAEQSGPVSDLAPPEGTAAPTGDKFTGSELPELEDERRELLCRTYDREIHAPVFDDYLEALMCGATFTNYGLPADPADVFIGQADVADPEELMPLYEHAKEVAAAFPESWIAHLGAAWAAWAVGRGTWAGMHADTALPLTPEGRDATRLFLKMVGAGVLPRWAQAPRRAE